MTVAILIPAAGFSRRMRGTDKLVLPVDGEPLLRRLARLATETGAPVIVTLPPADDPRSNTRRAALDGLPLVTVTVADPGEGMAASIRAGLAAVPDTAEGLMILLADLPEIRAEDLVRMIDAFGTQTPRPVLRATAEDGTPGHPVIFPRDLFPELERLQGDTGPRPVLAAHRDWLRTVALPGRRATTDLDTPEAWAAWRAETGR